MHWRHFFSALCLLAGLFVLPVRADHDEALAAIAEVDAAIAEESFDRAATLAAAAVDQHPDWWELRLRLAAARLLNDDYDRSARDAAKILALEPEIEADTQARQPVEPPGVSGGRRNVQVRYDPYRLNQQVSSLAIFLRVGRYASASRSRSRQGVTPLQVHNFGQGLFVARAIVLGAAAANGELDKRAAEMMAIDSAGDATEIEQAWRGLHVAALQAGFAAAIGTADHAYQQRLADWKWRLAELDDQAQRIFVPELLQHRDRQRQNIARGQHHAAPPRPLTPAQTALIEVVYREQLQLPIRRSNPALVRAICTELNQLGRTDDADRLRQRHLRTDTIAEAQRALSLAANWPQAADVGELIRQIALQLPLWSEQWDENSRRQLYQAFHNFLRQSEQHKVVLDDPTRLQAIDLLIALQSAQDRRRPRSSTWLRWQAGIQSVQFRVRGQARSRKICVPLSDHLLPRQLASLLYPLTQGGAAESWTDRVTSHLAQQPGLFHADEELVGPESLLRLTAGAFVAWWSGELTTAYEAIIRAGNAAPQDDHFLIEQARIATDLGRPRLALDAIDSIDPTSEKFESIRQIAALRLANQTGQYDRAVELVDRLCAMKLDKQAESAVIDELLKAGFRHAAVTQLHRFAGREDLDAHGYLSLARKFAAAGHRDEAADAALKGLESIEPGHIHYANLLQQAGRLIQQLGKTERWDEFLQQQAKTHPDSSSLQMQLANHYEATGRLQEAADLWQQIAAATTDDANVWWQAGQKLYAAGQHRRAQHWWMKAIKKEPNRLQNGMHSLGQLAAQRRDVTPIYQLLTQLELKKLSPHTLAQALSLHRRYRQTPPPETIEFVECLLAAVEPHQAAVMFSALRSEPVLLKQPATIAALTVMLRDAKSYAPGDLGSATSLLRTIHQVASSDPDIQTAFREAVLPHLDHGQRQQTAQFFLVAIELPELSEAEVDQRLQPLFANATAPIYRSLWYDLRALLSPRSDLATLMVDVAQLLHERYYRPSPGNVDTGLVSAFVKAAQSDRARAYLLDALRRLRTTPFADDNNGTAAQRLRSYQTLAGNLMRAGAELEAAYLYAELLFDYPERLDASVAQFRRQWRQGIEHLLPRIRDDDFGRFALAQFDLGPLPASVGIKPAKTSLAAWLVDRLAGTTDGREQLQSLRQRLLDQRQADGLSSLSALGIEFLIDEAMNRDSAVERLRAIRTELQRHESDADVLALYSPVVVALASQNPQVVVAGRELAVPLIELAAQRDRQSIWLALTAARLAASGEMTASAATTNAFRQALDRLIPAEGAVEVSRTQVRHCLQLAQRAIDAEAYDAALSAIERVLCGGPPRIAGDDPPVTNTINRLFNPQESMRLEDAFESRIEIAPDSVWQHELSRHVANLFGQLTHHTTAQARFDALCKIVFPVTVKKGSDPNSAKHPSGRSGYWGPTPFSHAGRIYVYQIDPIASHSTSPFGHSSVKIDHGINAADRLCRAAVELAAAANGTDRFRLEYLAVETYLAVAIEDRPAAELALASVVETAAALTKLSTTQVGLLSSLVQQAEQLLGSAEPLADVQIALLSQAAQDQQYRRLDSLWQQMATRLMGAGALDNERAKLALELRMDGLALHLARYSPEHRQRQERTARIGLATAAIRGRRWSVAAELLRSLAYDMIPWYQTEAVGQSKALVWGIADALSEITPMERFELLKRCSFGEHGEKPLLMFELNLWNPSGAGTFGPQTTADRQSAAAILVHPDVALLSSAWLLAGAAAESGLSSELIELLAKRADQGDRPAETLAGLAALAAGDFESAGKAFSKLENELQNQPQQQILSAPATALVLRGLLEPSLADQAENLFDQLTGAILQRGGELTLTPLLRLAAKRNSPHLQVRDAEAIWQLGFRLRSTGALAEGLQYCLAAVKSDPGLLHNTARGLIHLSRSADEADQIYRLLLELQFDQIPPDLIAHAVSMFRRHSRGPSTVALQWYRHVLEHAAPVDLGNVFALLHGSPQLAELPETVTAIEKAFANESIFRGTARFWQSSTTLDSILRVLQQEPAVQERVVTDLRRHMENDAVLAPLLLLALETENLTAAEIKTRISKLLDCHADSIPVPLWHSLGRWLMRNGAAPQAAVSIARRTSSRAVSDPRLQYDQFLADALVAAGETSAARRYLMGAYRRLDYSASYAGRPDMAANQQLHQYQQIARRLSAIGAHVQAAMIYGRELTDRRQLELASGGDKIGLELQRQLLRSIVNMTNSCFHRFLVAEPVR